MTAVSRLETPLQCRRWCDSCDDITVQRRERRPDTTIPTSTGDVPATVHTAWRCAACGLQRLG